jgi:tetrahydromethanopterin S-methyltransferase subunit G
MRESIQHDFDEGITVARDCSLWLPSEKYPQCTCDCWREENDRLDQEDEQCQMFVDEQFRLFGGDVGDDVSLLPAMLEVVRFLWGDIDYIDP